MPRLLVIVATVLLLLVLFCRPPHTKNQMEYTLECGEYSTHTVAMIYIYGFLLPINVRSPFFALMRKIQCTLSWNWPSVRSTLKCICKWINEVVSGARLRVNWQCYWSFGTKMIAIQINKNGKTIDWGQSWAHHLSADTHQFQLTFDIVWSNALNTLSIHNAHIRTIINITNGA